MDLAAVTLDTGWGADALMSVDFGGINFIACGRGRRDRKAIQGF